MYSSNKHPLAIYYVACISFLYAIRSVSNTFEHVNIDLDKFRLFVHVLLKSIFVWSSGLKSGLRFLFGTLP